MRRFKIGDAITYEGSVDYYVVEGMDRIGYRLRVYSRNPLRASNGDLDISFYLKKVDFTSADANYLYYVGKKHHEV